MIGRNKGSRIPIYKRAECLGEDCPIFNGQNCESRLELLEATGESGGKDEAPYADDCSYALYGQVCMSGAEQVVVKRIIESPNHRASAAELVGRSMRTDDERIVLNTPPEVIMFDS